MIIQNGGRKVRKKNKTCNRSKMVKKQKSVPEDANKELEAPLSKKTIEYLKEQGITMDAIIQFELKETKIIDENSEDA